MNEEEARAALKWAQEQKLADCREAVAEVLEQYGCRLVATPFVTADGRIAAQVGLAIAENGA